MGTYWVNILVGYFSSIQQPIAILEKLVLSQSGRPLSRTSLFAGLAVVLARARVLYCCPIVLFSMSITKKIVACPSLKAPAAIKAAVSKIFFLECKCCRQRCHTVRLNDSFSFCVCPPKNLVKRLSLEKSL